MYLSIKPQLQQQAQEIATKRPETFKNWQAVLQLAVTYGLAAMQYNENAERAAEVRRYTNKTRREHVKLTKVLRNVPMSSRTCRHTGLSTNCPPTKNCRDCT